MVFSKLMDPKNMFETLFAMLIPSIPGPGIVQSM